MATLAISLRSGQFHVTESAVRAICGMEPGKHKDPPTDDKHARIDASMGEPPALCLFNATVSASGRQGHQKSGPARHGKGWFSPMECPMSVSGIIMQKDY
ncbi:hypothetical protein Bbelb_053970 [Branchiostoma belcheri]|nr:hypothetical protein Bbelb_053970 [Branchiostoma belcheri]